MLHQYPRLLALLLVLLGLRLGLDDWLSKALCLVLCLMAPGLHELVLLLCQPRSARGGKACMAYVSEDYASLLVHLGLVVVVYAESREEDLVLVLGERSLPVVSERHAGCGEGGCIPLGYSPPPYCHVPLVGSKPKMRCYRGCLCGLSTISCWRRVERHFTDSRPVSSSDSHGDCVCSGSRRPGHRNSGEVGVEACLGSVSTSCVYNTP